MTSLDDFKKLVKGMKAVYTRNDFLPDAEAVAVWYHMLKDIPYALLSYAVQKHMATCKFPPTIAEIRAASVIEDCDPWGEAWEKTKKAIAKYGIYREREAVESLDTLTQQTVKRLGFKELCMSENIMQDRANFRMIYEQEAQRQNELAQLPENVKTQLSKLNNQTKAIGGE